VARRPAGDIAAAQGELTAEACRPGAAQVSSGAGQTAATVLRHAVRSAPAARLPWLSPDERTVLQELFDFISSRPRWLVARPVAAAFIGRELSWPRFVPPSVPPSGQS
jgi:hypothetical protein